MVEGADGMSKEIDYVEVPAKVLKLYQKHQYLVELENGRRQLFGQLNGRMASNHIWLSPGDRCLVQVSIYDVNRCRVVKRY